MKSGSLYALTAFTLAFSPAAWSTAITAITPNSAQVMLANGAATVRFTVSGQGSEAADCGMWIEYGDKGSPDTRIIGKEQGMLPRTFDHNFTTPGQYTVTAKGQRVKQTFGCDGSASTLVTVVEERLSRRRAAAQACPDGWQISQGSFDRQTGAFTCVAAYPAQQITCGPGLVYFEDDNSLGCRTRSRGHD